MAQRRYESLSNTEQTGNLSEATKAFQLWKSTHDEKSKREKNGEEGLVKSKSSSSKSAKKH